MINFKIIINIVSVIVFLIGTIMFFPALYALGEGDSSYTYLIQSALISQLFGTIFYLLSRKSSKKIGKREGYLIVTLAWFFACIFGSLPYFFHGGCGSISNAFFESVSGLTTTGATIFGDIEKLPSAILLWRSITQWLGGMGIIVLTVAIFPLLGVGGVELFVAESPGPTSHKIHPRIKETAKRLWLLYVSLTVLLIFILFIEGMTPFDALNHGLTTIATGGFSTKNASVAHFTSPLIQYTILFFMLLSGVNYSLIYVGLKGKFSKVWASDEFKTYIAFVFFLSLALAVYVFLQSTGDFETAFRISAFQVVSIITSTGYVIMDYSAIHPSVTMIFFFLFFVGACAGSTSGGIKFIRHIVFAKNSILEFKRLLHPNALIRLKIDNGMVSPRILTHVLIFLLVYLMIFLVGTFVMSFILADFDNTFMNAAGTVASSLGNIGPTVGSIGPFDDFSSIPPAGKWVLSFIMLLGRLELFSVLILFTPYFWRDH